MMVIIRRVARSILPAGSYQRMLLGRVKQILLGTNRKRYQEWISKVEPSLFLETQKKLGKCDNRPLISIVLPCYNTPKRYFDALFASIQSQTYDNWQLCIADGSTEDSIKKYIKDLSDTDSKVIYHEVGENKGIVGNTNEAISMAEGEYVAFVDHDDVLSPHALAEVVIALNVNPESGLIYSDEDKLSDNGKRRLQPFFKPDWSPELLLGINYITHLVVAKKSIVEEIGGLRSGFEGAQDYDFLLRITEKIKPYNIVHIPKILYHWRLAQGSTAKSIGEKDYASSAGVQALQDALKRRNINATVQEVTERPTNYKVSFGLPSPVPKVSIIIPFKDKPELLKQCVGSILEKTTYSNFEIILLSNNSVEQETERILTKLSKDTHCAVYYWNHTFNYSKINNFGVSKATGDYVVLLNNDTELISEDWLEELVGVASQPGIGAVGPALLYPEKKYGLQHAGVIVGMGGMAGHVFRHRSLDEPTMFGMPGWPRDYLAVTGACLMVSKKLYEEVGGLDETFTITGNDVAFGITLYEAGYRNVYWPFVTLYHYESVSVGGYDNGVQLDYDHSLKYYKKYHDTGDPYFNPQLDLMNEAVVIRGYKR